MRLNENGSNFLTPGIINHSRQLLHARLFPFMLKGNLLQTISLRKMAKSGMEDPQLAALLDHAHELIFPALLVLLGKLVGEDQEPAREHHSDNSRYCWYHNLLGHRSLLSIMGLRGDPTV